MQLPSIDVFFVQCRPDYVHQFSAGQGTGNRDDYQVSTPNPHMFENFGLRGVSDVSGQSILLRDLDVVQIDVDDHLVISVRRDEALRRSLTSWPESNDEDRIASPRLVADRLYEACGARAIKYGVINRLMIVAKTMARNDVSDNLPFSAPSPRAIVARTKENSPTWARQNAEAIAIQPM